MLCRAKFVKRMFSLQKTFSWQTHNNIHWMAFCVGQENFLVDLHKMTPSYTKSDLLCQFLYVILFMPFSVCVCQENVLWREDILWTNTQWHTLNVLSLCLTMSECLLFMSQNVIVCLSRMSYGVASVTRINWIIGLFCKRALEKRRYSAKETCNLIDPTDRSHPYLLRTLWFVCSNVLSNSEIHNTKPLHIIKID